MKSHRLEVLADTIIENSFVVQDSEKVFARINFINNKWYVWFYHTHIQQSFEKLKSALIEINKKYIEFIN